ncbi:MAG: hypothetical protein K8R39_05575 [Arcobacteraceae bacterium]|nr:hypothetical protein [Arcobacteraceae bacterium]
MLHEQLLQQQLAASQSSEPNFNTLPSHVMTTLDNMAFGIAQKEDLDSFEVKQKLVANINKLGSTDMKYLVDQMSMLIEKSSQDNETISDKNVDKEFVTFLIRLFY